MQTIPEIDSDKPPRETLAADIPWLEPLPIRGGWGYTREDACIIDKNDPLVDPAQPFDGIAIERAFVEARIHEEMVILPPEGERFEEIQWQLLEQRLVTHDWRRFDMLRYEITAFREKDWKAVMAELGKAAGNGQGFDNEAYEKALRERTVRFTREFWFDIESWF